MKGRIELSGEGSGGRWIELVNIVMVFLFEELGERLLWWVIIMKL